MLLFWLLSWLGDRFYRTKTYKATNNVYECGFTTTHALRVSINFAFFIVALLLILYDIEFFFLIPIFFNITNIGATTILPYWIFLVFVILSFIIDWESPSLKWV